VGDGVLVSATVEAGGDVLAGDLVLMAHTTKGGEGIVNKGDVVKNKGRGGTFAQLEGRGDTGEIVGGRVAVRGRDDGARRVEEGSHLLRRVGEGVLMEGVIDDGFIDGGTGNA